MYAIVEIGGHQYKVAENDVLFVDKQNADSDSVTFDNVLLLKDDKGAVKVGKPVVEGASVTATILETVKSDKVLVFKKKRRKGYRVKNGHRQYLSKIEIQKIDEKAAAKKAEAQAAEAKPTLGDANDALQALKDKMDGKK